MRPHRQRGLSLVELMIGVTIGLALLAALGSLYVATSKARAEFNKTGEQVENGRYALESIARDVEMAGFFGRPGLPVKLQYSASTICAIAKADMGFDGTTSPITVPVAVSGVAATAATTPTCLTNMVAGTEALTVRYASGNTTPSPSSSEFYLQQSSCKDDTTLLVYDTKSTNFSLRDKSCVSTKTAELRKYVVRTYYLANCDNCTAGDNMPTLKVAEFVNGSIQVSSLVAGVQDVHFSYGVDTDNNGSPDCYVDDPSADNTALCKNSGSYAWTNATTNWSNVTAVRITVLARNLDQTVGWSDTRTYDLGRAAQDGPYNDTYKRHVYSAVARVWNVGGVREN